MTAPPSQFNPSPCDLFIAPLWSISSSVLQGFQHQQVALSVAKQQICISTTCSIQESFHSLEGQSKQIDMNAWLSEETFLKSVELGCFLPERLGLWSCFDTELQESHLLQQPKSSNAIPGVPGQGHGLQQAAQSLSQRVNGESWRDGVKMLLHVCN